MYLKVRMLSRFKNPVGKIKSQNWRRKRRFNSRVRLKRKNKLWPEEF